MRRDDGSFCLLFIIFRFPHDVTVSRLLGCRRGGEEEGGGCGGGSYLLTLPGHKRVILTPHILQTTLSSGVSRRHKHYITSPSIITLSSQLPQHIFRVRAGPLNYHVLTVSMALANSLLLEDTINRVILIVLSIFIKVCEEREPI